MRSQLKGNLLVGQSGGCTAVMNASLVGVIREALRHPDAIETIYGAVNGIEGVLREDLVDLGQEGPDTLHALVRTPGAALGSSRHKLTEGERERILKLLQAHHVRCLIYIGGNDSADTAHRLAQLSEEAHYDLRVVVVPKTIDNDLTETDHSPGYGSIARFVAMATADAGKDSEAMTSIYAVKIIEVMGRNSGWVAAASALSKNSPRDAPHLIYVPERPLAADRFLQDVRQAHDRHGFVVAVVAETIKDEKGKPWGLVPTGEQGDAFGHPRMAGAASVLADLIERRLGWQTRWERPGSLQRISSVCVSPVDRREAYRVGRRAVIEALRGHTDAMVTLVRIPTSKYYCTTRLASLDMVANAEKHLPGHYLNAEGNFVTEAFLEYARPLIGPLLLTYGELGRSRIPRRC